jgi:hypothetical protein
MPACSGYLHDQEQLKRQAREREWRRRHGYVS